MPITHSGEAFDHTHAAWLDAIEIQTVTIHLLAGDVRGFRWRYRVRHPTAREDWQQKAETTDWVFAPLPEVERMLAHWQQHVALAKTGRRSSTAQ